MDRYAAFAAGLPVSGAADGIMEGIPSDYRRRRGIETGYGQIEQGHAKTAGRRQGIRLPVFLISVFAYNMWAVERNKRGLRCRRREFTLPVVAREPAGARQKAAFGIRIPRAAAGSAWPLRRAQFRLPKTAPVADILTRLWYSPDSLPVHAPVRAGMHVSGRGPHYRNGHLIYPGGYDPVSVVRQVDAVQKGDA